MKVTIDRLAERRLWAFIDAKTVEVGGMGYAYLDPETGNIDWTHTFLVPQEVSSAEVDFEGTFGDESAIERATADGVLDDPNFIWVSWHSHHSMNAYWSSTDNARIAAMRKVGVNRLLSFVGNHKHEYELRLDVFGVSAHDVNIGQVIMGDLKLTGAPADADPFDEAIKSELAEYVTHKTYKYPSVTEYSKSNSKSKGKSKSNSKDKRSKWDHELDLDDQNTQDLIDDLFAEGWTPEAARDLILAVGVDSARAIADNHVLTNGGSE